MMWNYMNILYCHMNGQVIGLFEMKDRNTVLFSTDIWLTDSMLFIACLYILYTPKALITLFTKQLGYHFWNTLYFLIRVIKDPWDSKPKSCVLLDSTI